MHEPQNIQAKTLEPVRETTPVPCQVDARGTITESKATRIQEGIIPYGVLTFAQITLEIAAKTQTFVSEKKRVDGGPVLVTFESLARIMEICLTVC